jgi:integrase
MYSVDDYLEMLVLAKRSRMTVKRYRGVFRSFAQFLEVPVDEVHNHLSAENLIKYAVSRKDKSERGTQNALSILHRYMQINGVQFDVMQKNIFTLRCTEERDDKPLELQTLQRMMDLGSIQAKAIISTLISTGMRAGECSQLLLSDLNGDTITIPNKIAKSGRGGKVYLTTEAQEFIGLWLKERDQHIRRTTISTRNMFKEARKDDQRLFACSYNSIQQVFSRLYMKVDGEQGKYRAKCTPHSTRRYFRTHAVRSMPLDTVEKILRHSGYLTDAYVRISDEEVRKQFHAGEASLYITRKDHRIAQSEIDTLRRERDEQAVRISELADDMVLLKKVVGEIRTKGK